MGRPDGWGVVGLFKDPTPGDPEGVRLLQHEYRKLAREAASAAQLLRSVKTSTSDQGVWYGEAATSFVEQIGDFPEMLDKCETSYTDVVTALGSWRHAMDAQQAKADRNLIKAKEARQKLDGATCDAATTAKSLFDASSNRLTSAEGLLKRWEGLTPPAHVKLPTANDISILRSARSNACATYNAAKGDLDAEQARFDAARALIAEAKADYDGQAVVARKAIDAAKDKAVPRESIWKKIANSKAWQIIVQVVTVVLVIAVVVALVVGTGGGVLAAILLAADLILTLDDVAQFMAGNMSGAEFALAIAMNFIPGGKVALALTKGVKRAVRPLAKVAGALGALKGVTVPAMAKLAEGLRKAGENLVQRIKKIDWADDTGSVWFPGMDRLDDLLNSRRKGGGDVGDVGDAATNGARKGVGDAGDAAKGVDDAGDGVRKGEDATDAPRNEGDDAREGGRSVDDDTADAPRAEGENGEIAESLMHRDEEIMARLGLSDEAIEELKPRYLEGPGAPAVVGDRVVIPNGNGATMSVQDYVRVRHASTWNDDAPVTMLGKYIRDNPESYVNQAELAGARHFNLGKDGWGHVMAKHGLSEEQMFELFNAPFLKETIARGRQVQFSQQPVPDGSALWWEYQDLLKHGYVMKEPLVMVKRQ